MGCPGRRGGRHLRCGNAMESGQREQDPTCGPFLASHAWGRCSPVTSPRPPRDLPRGYAGALPPSPPGCRPGCDLMLGGRLPGGALGGWLSPQTCVEGLFPRWVLSRGRWAHVPGWLSAGRQTQGLTPRGAAAEDARGSPTVRGARAVEAGGPGLGWTCAGRGRRVWGHRWRLHASPTS